MPGVIDTDEVALDAVEKMLNPHWGERPHNRMSMDQSWFFLLHAATAQAVVISLRDPSVANMMVGRAIP